jgi:hypothetical protein
MPIFPDKSVVRWMIYTTLAPAPKRRATREKLASIDEMAAPADRVVG